MPGVRNPTKKSQQRSSGRRSPQQRPSAAPLTTYRASDAAPEIPTRLLDPDALTVIHRLRSFGHQAYLVGGCVRDLLLGREPKDFDVATSAHPGEIRAIFRNCRLIGRRFRLAHVYFQGGKIVETATFRANPNGGQAQSSDLLITRDNVFGTAEEDARRRDFTVNGLSYDVVLGRVIDYVGGKEDLKQRLIRTIGDPDVRIQEDPVRLLRAVRFSAKLGLRIEPHTWDALVRHRSGLARCAPARVLEEIFRLLRSGAARACVELLLELDALDVLLPPLAAHLRNLGDEGREGFFTTLDLLDRVVNQDLLPDDGILLAVLLSHLAMDEGWVEAAAEDDDAEEDADEKLEAGDANGEDEVEAEELESELAPVPWSVSASATNAEELLRELSRSARLPRRLADRAHTILRTLKVLTGARRRRGSPMRLVRQVHFSDSLFVTWLWAQGTGQGREALDRWVERAKEAGVDLPWLAAVTTPAPPVAPQAAAAEAAGQAGEREGKAKRRRRRGKGGASQREATSAEQEAASGLPEGTPAQRETAPALEQEGGAPAGGQRVPGGRETLPPEHERRPPPGPADFLPF